MKKRYFFILLFEVVFLLSYPREADGQRLVLNNHKSSRSVLNQTLPFSEDWESLSFATNNWSKSGNEWIIDPDNGHGGASAEFDGSAGLVNYTSYLTSDWIDSVNTGNIYVKFDVMLEDIDQSGTEWFYPEVFNGSEWIIIDSLSNNGSFSWVNKQYDITKLTKYKTFKIRFRTGGLLSSSIIGWFVDNIEVYKQCGAPKNLDASFLRSSQLNAGCRVAWEAPDLPQVFWPYLGYDSGNNFSGIGLSDGSDFTVAIRWDTGSLMMYDSCLINQMVFYTNPLSSGYFIVKIWTGANAANLIYSDTLTNVQPNCWTTVDMNDTLYINGNLEYWFGYKIVGQQWNEYPAGVDEGPAVSGYGDLVKVSEISEWDTLSNYGFDNNWNLEVKLTTPNNSPDLFDTLLGYNIYRAFNYDTLYDKIATVLQEDGIIYYEYNDHSIPSPVPETICYKVNAYWKNSGDTCYSDFAPALNAPNEDHVCLLYDAVNSYQDNESRIILFPNPANDFVKIQSENPLGVIELYDLSGKKLRTVSFVHKHRHRLNISGLPRGIYLIKTVSKKEVNLAKFVRQ